MTMADPIRDNAGGHYWTPNDFKSAKQADPEHLDRRGLMEHQVGGSHYLGKSMQPWDIIEAWGLDFWEGSAISYIMRRKPGVSHETDLLKAIHYLQKKIEVDRKKSIQE